MTIADKDGIIEQENDEIGNPIYAFRNAYGVTTLEPKPSKKKLDIKQADFPGGTQVWGSNAAFLWTSGLNEEEGIHVHAFRENASIRRWMRRMAKSSSTA